MAKLYMLVLVVALLFLCHSICSSATFCYDTSTCEEGKKCCGNVCLKRQSCDGKCLLDNECDEDYGELCVEQQCTCASSPCLNGEATTKIICHYDLQCPQNETCKDSVCQEDEPTDTQPLNTTVLAVVATVGLIVFAGAFYLCLRQQKSTRPSIAAKEAHHKAILERKRENSIKSDSNTSLRNDFAHVLERGNAKRHLEHKHLAAHKKPPLSSPCSMVELSAIIEEDEVSEVVSK